MPEFIIGDLLVRRQLLRLVGKILIQRKIRIIQEQVINSLNFFENLAALIAYSNNISDTIDRLSRETIRILGQAPTEVLQAYVQQNLHELNGF